MSFLAILFTLAIWALIFYVLWWGVEKIGFPEPFNKIMTFVLVVAIVYVAIGVLTGYIHPFPFLHFK